MSLIVQFCKVQLARLAPSMRVTLRRLVQTQCDEVAYAKTKSTWRKVKKRGALGLPHDQWKLNLSEMKCTILSHLSHQVPLEAFS